MVYGSAGIHEPTAAFSGEGELVELAPPDLAPFAVGNTGIPYVWSFAAAEPGPHVAVNALMHGNELAGAIALVRLLAGEVRPIRGRLSLSFANVAAFARFERRDPRAARYIDEDMNRVWSAEVLAAPRTSEARRAAELLPILGRADLLLDLHSMQMPGPALLLCTVRDKGRRLAARLGTPAWVVADRGHANGTRLIDFGAFGDPMCAATAILLEAGRHWRAGTAEVAFATSVRFLEVSGAIAPERARELAPEAGSGPQHFVEVSEAVIVGSKAFRFVREFAGLELVPRAGTLIATDGERRIVTPHDDCVLVMPSGRIAPGLTAVRLGRLVDPPEPAVAET